MNGTDRSEYKKPTKQNGDCDRELTGARVADRQQARTHGAAGCDLIWWTLLLGVTAGSLITRLHKLEAPNRVCWDETHFGKMGSWYINRSFFFDVHPPLGKMLIGLSGYMTGYNGSFPFSKPGDEYGDTPYLGMRTMCALFGASIVPLSFLISWELSRSYGASVLAATLVTLDTGLLTLSQYILLDPILIAFILAAAFCLLKFHSCEHHVFSVSWCYWLCSTGVFLACSIGVKFVGLFIILLVGSTVAADLWNRMSLLHISMSRLLQEFLARVLGLILLPAAVYALIFYIHFRVLTKSGSGDGFFSSAFQSRLEGNTLYNVSMPQYAAYGSVVTIKNHRTGGAYLHSHWHLYPEGVGARQQQVTTYSHKDDNNRWRLKYYNRDSPEGEPVRVVRSGDLVRLEHLPTRRNLHSHRERAPLTRQHYQVSCYGENGTGDANDVFRVDIAGGAQGEPLQTVRSVFRLVHYNTGCGVQSHSKQLPKWGWEQLEVTCNPRLSDKKTLWNVEEVSDSRQEKSSFEVYAPSFLEIFVESHAVMTQGNKGIKPREGETTSQPWQWPVNYKGQRFSGGDHRVYLLGNPAIWWLNLLVLVSFCLVYLSAAIYRRRRQADSQYLAAPGELQACGWLLIGWAFHFLPFWTMTRVLYFHHYFPAFIFSCILSGVFIDYVLGWLCHCVSVSHGWVIYHTVFGGLIGVLGYSFYIFSPLAYGMSDDTGNYDNLRWLESWEI